MTERRWMIVALFLIAPPMAIDAAEPTSKARREAAALTAKIDRRIAEKWAEAKVAPVGPADDAEFLRRVSLDLVGKIPTAADARDFLDDPSPGKRAALVDRLLESPAYTARATELYRMLLLPEADTDMQARFVAQPFEAWLRKKVAEEAGYDKIVRELLTAKLGAKATNTNTNNGRPEPSPVAYFSAKEGKPENLAAGASRVFLGVRLECAQCHNHPFAKWKREEFWGLAAFFAGVQGPGVDGVGALREVAGKRELTIPGTEKIVKAALLDGSAPDWKPRLEGREVLAGWITGPKNPFFAKAAVNRVWGRFFGAGIVDPIDDMGGDNLPSHPELLDELASEFVSHDYQLKYLIRAITASKAYGLTSTVERPDPTAPVLFSAMPVRGLSAGQLFACLSQATGFREGSGGNANGFTMDMGAQGRFLELFANRDEKPTEAQTSILQALTLMNGQIVSGATNLESGATLSAVAEAPYLDTAGRVEELYLAALTRRPSAEESSFLVGYLGKAPDQARALADIFWALLNGPEFLLNH